MHVRTHTHNIIDDEANNIGPSHAFSEIDANFDWEFGWDSMPQKSDNFCSLLMNEEVMESIKVQQISKHAPDVWPRIEIPTPLIVYLCHCFVLFSLFACLSQDIYYCISDLIVLYVPLNNWISCPHGWLSRPLRLNIFRTYRGICFWIPLPPGWVKCNLSKPLEASGKLICINTFIFIVYMASFIIMGKASSEQTIRIWIHNCFIYIYVCVDRYIIYIYMEVY
jgi:hypothetical protein